MKRLPALLLFFISLSTVPAAQAEPFTILALGDSTTAGTPGFRSPVEAPPEGEGDPESQYAFWIERARPDWKVLNRGVNGERTDEIRSRFEASGERASAIVVLAGVNDLYQGRSAERVKSELDALWKAASARAESVVVCTILPYDTAGSDVRERTAEVNAWIRSEAARRGFFFCDTHAAVSRSDGLLENTPDGLHPSAGGYRRMADALLPVLETVKNTKVK